MKRSMRPLSLALLGLLLLASALPAQGNPFQITYALPGDGDVRNTVVELAEGDLAGAMRAALNSEGDTMKLLLEVEGSVGVIANVGFLGAREVTIKRVHDGFELSFAETGGFSFGAEAMEGLEVSLPVGAELGAVMHFSQLEDIARALRATALAVIGLPALALERLRLQDLLNEALAKIPTLEQSVSGLTKARRAAHAGIVKLRKKVTAARKAFFKALAKAEKAMDKVGRIPIIGPILRAIAKGLFKLARKSEVIFEAIDRTLDKALASFDRLMRKFEKKAEELAKQVRIKEKAQADLNRVMDWISGCGGEVIWLGQRFKAFEGKFFIGAEVEASVAIENLVPGLTLANSGLGFNLGGEYAAGLRYDLPRGSAPGALTIILTRECNLGLSAVVLAGAEAEAKSELKIDLRFEHQGTAWTVDSSKTSLEVELGAWIVLGSGVSGEYGAGVTLEMVLDNLQVGQSIGGGFVALVQGNPQNAMQQFGAVQATFKAQGWRHMALVMGGGFSVAGDGLTLIGSATWRDAGPEHEVTVSAAQAIDAIINQTQTILNDVRGQLSAPQ